MKKLLTSCSALFVLFISNNLNAAIFDAGTFSNHGDTYVTSPYSGIFTDVFKFDIGSVTPLEINFTGSHTGMAGDALLLTNTASGQSFNLNTSFSETFDLGLGSYVFTLSGFALNALDRDMFSDYNLSIKSVPIPTAALLFGSALIGFFSLGKRRNASS